VNDVVWGRSEDLASILREHLNPDSIESVEILKAAPAVARFGPDAADGVILIQMRAGYAVPEPRG
jgi:outer membrane receptor protein involved in Fe transport